MARYTEAAWKPVDRYKPGGTVHQPITGPNRLIFHTAVSSGDSLFNLFNVPGNPVAHFYVRADGTVEQYVDTDTRASAVLDGNYDCITVESWDGGPTQFHGTDGPAWTQEQVEACAKLAAWCNRVHGIPLTALDDSSPGRGVGWHRLGIDGNFPTGLLHGRRPGTELWSPSAGKVCPGDSKIRGVVNDILPRAIEIANGDEDVQFNDEIPGLDGVTFGDYLRRSVRFMDNEAEFRASVLAEFDALEAAVADDATKALVRATRKKIVAKIAENAA